jgi:hypothetical protein
MEEFRSRRLKESFPLFERPAAKGHEESIWILRVVKDVELEREALKEAFAKTEEPLGWYFAGMLSDGGREGNDFSKKSAEAGCSWGQLRYAGWFWSVGERERDEKAHMEWLEKAANQNNPEAMHRLGHWFLGIFFISHDRTDEERAVLLYSAAAELGWKSSMRELAGMLESGRGCEKDLRQAVIWSAKGNLDWRFWNVLQDPYRPYDYELPYLRTTDFHGLYYSLGWGLYWYQYGTREWDKQIDCIKAFGNRCIDYYCACVEMQQKSIFTFLLCWKQSVGVSDVGVLIAKLVWEHREDHRIIAFEQNDRELAWERHGEWERQGEFVGFKPARREEPETKRIKK